MILSDYMRDILADACASQHDAGTIIFKTSAGNEIATLGFGDPAFGSASGGVITANAITSDPSATGGAIDHAELYDNATTPNLLETLTVTVSGGGGDIECTSLNVAATEKVNITSMSITIPAS